MTPKERKDYLARGLSLDVLDKLTKLEEAEKKRTFRMGKYKEENDIKVVPWDEISENGLIEDSFIALGCSLYYTMTPEDIYILRESIEEKNKSLRDALNSLKECEREFILKLFFGMNGNTYSYSREYNEKRETVRDRKIRILKKLKKFLKNL